MMESALGYAFLFIIIVFVTYVVYNTALTLPRLFLEVLVYRLGLSSKVDEGLMNRATSYLVLMFNMAIIPSLQYLPPPRLLEMMLALEPHRLSLILFDLATLVHSRFWDERRKGPDFISPMSSLTKRQSGHLARLLLEYSTMFLKFESGSTDIIHQDGGPRRAAAETPDRGSSHARTRLDPDSVDQREYPQAVVILDLDEVASDGVMPGKAPRRRLESQYATSADIDLMALVPIVLGLLVLLKAGQWFPAFEFIAYSFILVHITGPGTLKLGRKVAIHATELDPSDGCAVLINDDLTMMIRGSQRIVEAITEGGFYLSLEDHRPQPPAEDQTQVIISVTKHLEKNISLPFGLLILRLMGAMGSNTAVALLEITSVIAGHMLAKACRWQLQASTNNSLPPVAEVTPSPSTARKFLVPLSVAAFLALSSPTTILLYAGSFFVQASFPALFERLASHSNYPIRMDQLLDALGHPPIRKWPFLTRASAATFACLVLCRDIPRPVKNIDVLSVLDTLIPNQRDIWKVWKERVADRIAHEESINFAPTVPTFPDERQERFKHLLDEAQIGYNTYLSLPPRQSRGA